MHSECDECAKRQNSRRGAGAVLGTPSPCSHTQNFQANKTQSLFPAPAKRMRAQLHSRIVLSVDISAIITGILPWFSADVVDPECTQGHCYARHLKNTSSLKILHPKGASFSLGTAKQWKSLLTEAMQSPSSEVLKARLDKALSKLV